MKTHPYNYALGILARTPKTVKMMTSQLLKKGYPYDQVDRVIHKLLADDYLNDEAFCESYMRSEVINKGRSINITKKKLFEKGMPEEIIDNTLIDLEKEIDEVKTSHIARLIRKLHDRGDDITKIYQKLSRRGYRYEDIKKALEYMQETTEN